MKRSQSGDDQRPSASLNIPRIVWNSKFLYRVNSSLSLTPILSQLNPLNVLPFHVFQIHNNIILPFGSYVFQVVSFLQVSLHQNIVLLFSALRAASFADLFLL